MPKRPAINNNWSIIPQLADIAEQTGAINLSNDHSDFPCQPELLNSLVKYLSAGRNKYAPMEGVAELREIIANHYQTKYQANYCAVAETTITVGATQALWTAITTLIKDGDEVIVFEPAYQTYVPTIEAAGGRPIYYQLQAPDFAIDWCTLPKLINARTKLIIINSPHNPTGMVLSPEDLDQLYKMVNGTNINILSDESFGELVYDGKSNVSISSHAKLRERSIVVGSLGKSLCVPGWKIGYCLAPKAISASIRETHRFQINSVNLPIQLALADYLSNRNMWFPYLEEFQARRDLFLELIQNTKLTAMPVSGAYYQVLSYKNISNESDMDFALNLARNVGVTALPLSMFYHDGVDNKMVRVCFGKSEEELRTATERLAKL